MSVTLRNLLFLIVLPLSLLTACSMSSIFSDSSDVTVENGRLSGVEINGVHAYKGIPYAAPPVGELRWRPPQPAADWSGTRDASAYAPHCAQVDSEILWFELDANSEDCLTVNVWSPDRAGEEALGEASGEALPVMVWIHGGGYSNGSGNIARLNSPVFAAQGVVLVTVNYRLSIFGYLNHPAIAASNPADPVGNYGLQDVVASLGWVQRNIAAFGGNPDNVTIFGESAGAGIVDALLVMPSAEGLFHGAISESSAVGLAPEPYPDRRAGFQPPANKIGQSYVKKLGIKNYKSADPALAAELRLLTTEQLLAPLTMNDRYTPVIDGEILPDQVARLTAAGKIHKVPYLAGGNSWEASLGRQIGGGFSPEFAGRLIPAADKARVYPGLEGAALDDVIFGDLIVHSGTRYSLDRMAEQGVPVYSYYLTYIAEARRDSQPGAAHTDDIAFVLQTLDNEGDLDVISARDREISKLMSAYWVQFARNGNPNGAGLPEWPAYKIDDRQVLEIGDEIVVRENLFDERMQLHIGRGLDLLDRATR